ncbi:MAG: nitrate reductase molybdenum cofactor assembly chaperone [Rickettsiaceae bacterium]|nr:nitrate reductase molybdenum cofactor assembly chaperone [Rickettsiaceae bacterium]
MVVKTYLVETDMGIKNKNSNESLKYLSVLLLYPESFWLDDISILYKELLAKKHLSSSILSSIEKLINKLTASDLIDTQEEYVNLFDRSPSITLYLFEHVYGESRDRGQAMVDLSEMYKKNGLDINVNELPDYLPLFLEYLSTISQNEAFDLLSETIDIVAILRGRLVQRKSEYAAVFDAILYLCPTKANKERVNKALMAKQDDGKDLKKLDKKWKESPVY